MGRWSHLDTDEERLPEGMRRVGYDVDTQTYTYRDADGRYWEGAPGCQYGTLRRSNRAVTPPRPSICKDDDTESEEEPRVLYDLLNDYEGLPTSEPASTGPEKSNPRDSRSVSSKWQLQKDKLLTKIPGAGGDKLGRRKTFHGGEHAEVSEKRSKMTTIGERSTVEQLGRPRSLRRSGTLSRVTRFLSRSGGRVDGSVIATDDAASTGTAQKSGRLSRASTLHETTAQSRQRMRATTFDEILGESPATQ